MQPGQSTNTIARSVARQEARDAALTPAGTRFCAIFLDEETRYQAKRSRTSNVCLICNKKQVLKYYYRADLYLAIRMTYT